MIRLLLLRPGALGDLLVSAPALLALRSHFARAHITIAGLSEAAQLLKEASLVDEGISQDDPRLLDLFLAKADALRQFDWLATFDVAVCWLADPEGVVRANLERVGLKRIVIAPSAPPADGKTHVSDHLVATLSPIGIRMPRTAEPASFLASGTGSDREGIADAISTGRSTRLSGLPVDALAWAQRCLSFHNPNGAPPVIVHPGSGSARKNWPAARFSAVVDILSNAGVSLLVVCGPAEERTIESVLSNPFSPPPVLRNLPLSHLAALLAQCSAYLGNDSGVTHLAGLVGAPTVALFGPTDPAVWGPRGERVTILRWGGEWGELSPQEVAQKVLGII